MSDVEVLEPAEIVHQPIKRANIYQSTNPTDQLKEASERAKVLMDYVQQLGLAKRIGGGDKPHVQVEGWQFIGSQVGLYAVIEYVNKIEDGYEAKANLVCEGEIVGAGIGLCLRTERNWKNRDDYALNSMAQTRAISKAFRNSPVVAIMVMGGYSSTPAEEIVHEPAVRESPQQTPGEWFKKAVTGLKDWTPEQREQAYFAVVDELGLRAEDGTVDLTMESAKQIFEGMHKAWSIEMERPF
jgi:hypothetical protein